MAMMLWGLPHQQQDDPSSQTETFIKWVHHIFVLLGNSSKLMEFWSKMCGFPHNQPKQYFPWTYSFHRQHNSELKLPNHLLALISTLVNNTTQKRPQSKKIFFQCGVICYHVIYITNFFFFFPSFRFPLIPKYFIKVSIVIDGIFFPKIRFL